MEKLETNYLDFESQISLIKLARNKLKGTADKEEDSEDHQEGSKREAFNTKGLNTLINLHEHLETLKKE